MVRNHMSSMGGLEAYPLGKFCLLDSLELFLLHSQVVEYDHK